MAKDREKRVFSTSDEPDFEIRSELVDSLCKHAEEGSAGVAVFAAPGANLSALMGTVYDQLFFESEETIPFFFEFRKSDRTIKRAAVRFLHSFLMQFVAFQRREPAMVRRIPDVCEIGDLSSPSDADWMSRVIDSCKAESELNDEATFIRLAFAAFKRADQRVFPLIGGLEFLPMLDGEHDADEYLKSVLSSGSSPYMVGGLRRSLTRFVHAGESRLEVVRSIRFENLGFEDSVKFANQVAEANDIRVSEQTVDLLSIKFSGNTTLLRLFLESASTKGVALDSFKSVEQHYCEELFGGSLRSYFDGTIETLSAGPAAERRLIDNLFGLSEFDREPATAENWINAFGNETQDSLLMLNAFELVNLDSGLVRVEPESEVLKDYLTVRFRLEVERASRGSAFGDFLTGQLKKASGLMADHYRKQSSLGLRGILGAFNCQDVPVSLLFYNVFKELHKGEDDDKILETVKGEPEKFTLPQMVYTVDTVAVYPQIEQLTDRTRSAVAVGFEAADYTEEAEVVWIAAEVDSKLEADGEKAAFWCDRLEMVALMNGYRNYRIWLVAPEGFNEEAVEILASRGAIGSSRKQFELLVEVLGAKQLLRRNEPDEAFELVVPMGDDTELIAAHALEQLARQNHFSQKEINQIKTALVEACINATEHSHSPDRKIYQKFSIKNGTLEIIVSNRGLKFRGRSEEVKPDEGRRGWGLKLMKSLMDDVSFETVDDGTRIRMVKELAKG